MPLVEGVGTTPHVFFILMARPSVLGCIREAVNDVL